MNGTQEDTMTATPVTDYLPQYSTADDAVLYALSESYQDAQHVVVLAIGEGRYVWESDAEGNIRGIDYLYGNVAENDAEIFSDMGYVVID